MPLDYARIGAAMALFASDDDKQVGRAMDQIDWLLAQGGSSWAALGAEVSKLGARARRTDDPRRNGAADPLPWEDGPAQGAPSRSAGPASPTPRGTGGRPPSQWSLDRADVIKLYEHREQITWEAMRETFAPSFYQQCVEEQRTLSEKQRSMVHEWLDKLGL
jgi:hypothetical protein